MEQRKKSIRQSFRKANSIVHTLKNLYDKAADVDFREFEIMEYGDIDSEGVTDLKRLNYLRKLQLAQKGYISSGLKKQVAQQKEKQRLIDHNAKIIPLGVLKIVDGQLLCAELHIGYTPGRKTFQVAYANHESIPKWKDLDTREMYQFTSRIHPSQSDNLRLEHAYSANNVTHILKPEELKHLNKTYSQCVSEVFHSNKYFTKGILDPSEALLENPEVYIGKQFRLPFRDKCVAIFTLSEANRHYLSFQSFLETVPKPETCYFTIGEFKRLFLDSQIELIAHLKNDLMLGAKDGILFIGRYLDDTSKTFTHWDKYDSIIKTSELPVKVKYYLCKEVIMKKNFFVEKDAVYLQSQGKRAFLKKHYKTGKWHFAESVKPSEELHFRPITPEIYGYIRQQYSECKNFPLVEKQRIEINNGKTKNLIVRHG